MKIAVTSTGPTLDDSVEARFGRCAYFLVVDTDTMQCEPIENPNIALGGGAGIQSAQLMSENGVTTVLSCITRDDTMHSQARKDIAGYAQWAVYSEQAKTKAKPP